MITISLFSHKKEKNVLACPCSLLCKQPSPYCNSCVGESCIVLCHHCSLLKAFQHAYKRKFQQKYCKLPWWYFVWRFPLTSSFYNYDTRFYNQWNFETEQICRGMQAMQTCSIRTSESVSKNMTVQSSSSLWQTAYARTCDRNAGSDVDSFRSESLVYTKCRLISNDRPVSERTKLLG